VFLVALVERCEQEIVGATGYLLHARIEAPIPTAVLATAWNATASSTSR